MAEQTRMSREELEAELNEFHREKERVRKIVGQIGGHKTKNLDTIINISFLVVVLTVFIMGGLLHWIDVTLSLEIGVLLVSLKIAYMIREQEKVNHFQFWVLTSLEFRLNEMSKRNKKLETMVKEMTEKENQA